MKLTKINSSSIEALGYDPKPKQMQVMFKNNALYQYENISPEEYNSILNSPSAGAKLKEVVKGKAFNKL